MEKIEIARQSSINQALKSELQQREIKQQKTRRQAWNDRKDLNDEVMNENTETETNAEDMKSTIKTEVKSTVKTKGKNEVGDKEIYVYEPTFFYDDSFKQENYLHKFNDIEQLKMFRCAHSAKMEEEVIEEIKKRKVSYCTFDNFEPDYYFRKIIYSDSFEDLKEKLKDLNKEIDNKEKEIYFHNDNNVVNKFNCLLDLRKFCAKNKFRITSKNMVFFNRYDTIHCKFSEDFGHLVANNLEGGIEDSYISLRNL